MKICVITGGANGIGFTLSNMFFDNGYKVIAIDILNNVNLKEEIDFFSCDLKNKEQIKNVFAEIEKKYKQIDILINNAAISYFEKDILQVSDNEIDKIFDVNLKAVYLCCREFVRLNEGKKYGRIINIASTRWHQNEKNVELYGATKGGIVSLTNSLCISLADRNITVNAISPGYIEVKNYDLLEPREHEIHPSKRVGKPRDIGNACLFLCDEENDFINGHNLIIDGGMTKKMIY